MKIYEVWTTNDERSASCKGTCDSLESALEFAKTLHDWYDSSSVYENIMKKFKTVENLKENINECYSIKVKELITLATLKQQKKFTDKIYRIKHKSTGLYYTPVKNNHMNLSTRGKLYSTDAGWQIFSKIPFITVNRDSVIGRKILSGDIIVEHINWPKKFSLSSVHTPYDEWPEDVMAPKFYIKVDLSEWEKEYVM